MAEYGIRGPDGRIHLIGFGPNARELAELSRGRPGWSIMSRGVSDWVEVASGEEVGGMKHWPECCRHCTGAGHVFECPVCKPEADYDETWRPAR